MPLFNIVHAAFIAPGIKRFVIKAPRVARKQKPGQFVIVRLYENGERIPLTIERSDPSRGTINIVVQSAGKTTHLLNSLETGDRILDVVGPLGKPSEIENFGTVVVMGGGVGTAMAYPTAAALKKAGNRVISIVGARNKDLVILEREMREVSDTLLITTDDGSYDKGFVTDKLRQLIKFGTRIDLVLAVGPIPMMKAVADVAEKTTALANSGQTGLARMKVTVQQIVEASASIQSRLEVLNEKAGNIGAVITTIIKVADQTNLLSLNAAIEAEKAGDYGRGFAVVATEIRRLADQTAAATGDIEQTVKEMQSAVAAGVMGMDNFSEEVRRGVEVVQQVSEELSQIIQQVQTLTPNFETVSEGMQSQSLGAQQISDSLSQLSEAAKQTVDSLHQSNRAVEQLNQVARMLHKS